MEHYLSDFNLPKDKFLGDQTFVNDGWVTMGVTPNPHCPLRLTKNVYVISEISSGLLEVCSPSKEDW